MVCRALWARNAVEETLTESRFVVVNDKKRKGKYSFYTAFLWQKDERKTLF